MFENLKFDDTKAEVQKKLFASKRFTSPPATMLGRTGLNGFFTTKQQLAGLKFDIHFDWDDSTGPLTLTQVDLYSEETQGAKLKQTFDEVSKLLTQLYGNAKFNNGMPTTDKVPQAGMVMHNACWFYDEHAILLGLGKTDKGHSIVISFQKNQPQLTKTP